MRAMSVCVCACAHLRACARVRACTRAFVSACACVRAFPSDCVFAHVCVATVCACASRLRAPPIARRRLAVFIARPAPRVGGRARVVAVRCHRPGSRASAAGVTWTCRTANAGWAARRWHTSVVDAAGAIYVIGGGYNNGTLTLFNDVYASTDGGARPDSVGGWVGRVLRGYSSGSSGGY